MYQRIPYRGDIDGLRAIAVLSVVLHHIHNAWLPGGYAGVDIFFVISGYLLGGALWQELKDTGRIDLRHFYMRRIRRILPAGLAVILASLLMGMVMLQPERLVNLAQSGVASMLFYANHFFGNQPNDYFTAQNQAFPLLHYWSLSVEEQYYILLPFLLLVCYRLRGNIGLMLAILIAASLAFQYWALAEQPRAGFFWLPARFWELAMGMFIATRPALIFRNVWLKEIIGIACIALLAAGVMIAGNQVEHLQLGTLLTCLATAALIHSGRVDKSIVHRLLSTPPFIAVGLISYSLYLWHWPVLQYWEYLTKSPITLSAIPVYLLVCVALAFISWKWIEQPFRNKESFRTLPLLVTLGTMLAGLLLLCGYVQKKEGLPDRVNESLHTERMSEIYRGAQCLIGAPLRFQDLAPECIQTAPDKVNVLIFGDSHAGHFYPGLKEHLKDNPDVRLSQITMSACGTYWNYNPGPKETCIEFNEKAAELINTHVFDIILIGGNWGSGRGLTNEERNEKFNEFLEHIKPAGADILVLSQALRYENSLKDMGDFQTRGYISLYHLLIGDDLLQPKQNTLFKDANANVKKVADARQLPFVDTTAGLCSDGKTCAYRTPDGAPLTFDTAHLTREGSIYITGKTIMPILNEKIAAVKARKH